MNFMDERIRDVFWRNVMVEPNSGCWIWTRYTNKNGYGVHSKSALHSGSKLTHRYTYEVVFGALPPNTELDHAVCQTRACCNPHHVEPVPHAVNVQRGKVKKTHCKRGHALSGNNLLATRRGHRCLCCYQQHALDRAERRKRERIPRQGSLDVRTRCASTDTSRGTTARGSSATNALELDGANGRLSDIRTMHPSGQGQPNESKRLHNPQ